MNLQGIVLHSMNRHCSNESWCWSWNVKFRS